MKESHPIDLTEYSKARGLADDPTFAWWVPYTLQKKDIILSAVKIRICKMTHTYGVEIPYSISHTHEIDCKNGNIFWRDTITIEMTNIGVAF